MQGKRTSCSDQRGKAFVKRAANSFRGVAGDFQGLLHQLEREGNERVGARRQLDGADMQGTDFAKGPALEKPLSAVGSTSFEILSGFPFAFSVGAELDIVQH